MLNFSFPVSPLCSQGCYSPNLFSLPVFLQILLDMILKKLLKLEAFIHRETTNLLNLLTITKGKKKGGN